MLLGLVIALLVLFSHQATEGAVIRWAVDSGEWQAASNWSPPQIPSAADTVLISSGTVFNTSGALFDTLVLTNGAHVSGSLVVASGAQLVFGGGRVDQWVRVEANGLFRSVGISEGKQLWGGITNYGTVLQSGWGLQLISNTRAVNELGALWEIQEDGHVYWSSGLEEFDNRGTLRKSGGVGVSVINPRLLNAGSVEVETGTLMLNGGGGQLDGIFTVSDGARLDLQEGVFSYTPPVRWGGEGEYRMLGGTLTLHQRIPQLQILGGKPTLAPTFQGGAITNFTLLGGTLATDLPITGRLTVGGNAVVNTTNTVTGTLVLTNGGQVSGPLVVASGAEMVFGGGRVDQWVRVESNGVLRSVGTLYAKQLWGGITNRGTIVQSGWGLQVLQGNVAVNEAGALWDIQDDYHVYWSTGSELFDNRGVLRKSGGIGVSVINPRLINSGSVEVSVGTLMLNGGGALLDGNFDVKDGARLDLQEGVFAYTPPVHWGGAGEYRFVGGTLTLDQVIPKLQLLGGRLSVSPTFQGGAITNFTLSGGTLTTDLPITGRLTVAGSAVVNTTNTVTGTLVLTNAAQVSGPLVVASGGELVFGGGRVDQWVRVESNGVLRSVGTTLGKQLWGGITNRGKVLQSGWGLQLLLGRSAVNEAGALWEIQDDGHVYWSTGLEIFENRGTLRKSGGVAVSVINPRLINSGLVEVAIGTLMLNGGGGQLDGAFNVSAGARLDLQEGVFAFTPPLKWEGAGDYRILGGTLTLEQLIPQLQILGGKLTLSPTFQGGAITNLNVSGASIVTDLPIVGELTASGNAVITLMTPLPISGRLTVAGNAVVNTTNTVTGTLVLTNAGQVSGPLVLASGAEMVFGGGRVDQWVRVESNAVLRSVGTLYAKQLWGGITNRGSILQSGWGLQVLQGNLAVNEAGALWDIQDDYHVYWSTGSELFYNRGVLRKSGGIGVSVINPRLINSGSVEVLVGTLMLNGGGAQLDGNFDVKDGARLDLQEGAFAYTPPVHWGGAGEYRFVGGTLTLDQVIPKLQLLGGRVSVSPTFQGGAITNFTMSGGTLTTDLPITGLLTVGGNAVLNTTNRVTGTLVLTNTSQVSGPLVVAAGGELVFGGGRVDQWVRVESNGVLRSVGTTLGKQLWGGITNRGTVLQSGWGLQVLLGKSAVNEAGGLWDILDDCHVYWSTGAELFENRGVLRKTGGVGASVINPRLVNSGAVEVRTGTLNPNGGTFEMAGGLLRFGFSNTNDFGTLQANGPVILGGGVEALFLNGFIPPIDARFQVMTFPSRNGAFTNTSEPFYVGSGRDFVPTLSATSLSLVASATSVPEPPSLTLQPIGGTRLAGGGMSFSAFSIGSLPLRYQWWKSGSLVSAAERISGANAPVLVITNLQSSDAGRYSLVITNNYGAITSHVAELSVLPAVLSPGLLAYYSLDGDGLDRSGNAYDGQVLGGTLTTNRLGQTNAALELKGDSYVKVEGIDPDNYNEGFSYGAWVRRDGAGGWFLWRESGGWGSTFLQGLEAFSWRFGSGNPANNYQSDGLLPPVGDWFSVVVTHSTNSDALYLNGVLVTNHPAGTLANNASTLELGHGYNYATVANCALDEVRIYQRALTAEDVYSLYSNQAGLVPSVLVQPHSRTNVPSTTAQFSVTVQGGGPLGYQWRKDGWPLADDGRIAGATLATLSLSGVQAADAGAYSVVITNTFGSVTSDVVSLTVTLPLYTVTVESSPSDAGNVQGAGLYFHGTTNVLTAYPAFGYRFSHWAEAAGILGTNPTLTIVVTTNRSLVAHYAELNPLHTVTTATQPSQLALISGGGTYTNGQKISIAAPPSVTRAPTLYTFREFRVNGSFGGNSTLYERVFTTLDPTNLDFVAVYDSRSILPLIANATANVPFPVPSTSNLVLRFQFNRSMNTNVSPHVVITNANSALQPVVRAGGTWSATAVANDTFTLPPIALASGMDGTHRVIVSEALDLFGGQLESTNAMIFVADVTPPQNPVLTLTSSNSISATVSWLSYSPPGDLNSFRVYLSTNPFNSVAELPPVSSLGVGARQFTYSGLSLDRRYFASSVAVDAAGNSTSVVSPLEFIIPSTVPPQVPTRVTAAGSSSALLDWGQYNTAPLLGFAGYRIYAETTPFTRVDQLTPRQTLPPEAQQVQLEGLDRSLTYYLAVVGFNGKGDFNADVVPGVWSDPYAGVIVANVTLGGAGQVVDILQSITVVSNAVLTIPAGTTLRFAAGKGLFVSQGSVVANGTALDPIVFQTIKVPAGQAGGPGDWNGIILGSGAGASVLRHVFVQDGGGLSISNCSPTVDAFSAVRNTPAGLTLQGPAAVNLSQALLSFNEVGVQQLGASQIDLRDSVIKNNGVNAIASGPGRLVAVSNWWGVVAPGDIDALLQGPVIRSNALSGEPLLTPALGGVGNVIDVGSATVPLRLACRTAETMRLSEDPSFKGVFFSPFTNRVPFSLSPASGTKTVYAQFRSLTGQTSERVALTLRYINSGPTLTAWTLDDEELLTRPRTITASASAPLGVFSMEFYVDGVGVATNGGGLFTHYFDIRTLAIGNHRARILARDNSGNTAVEERTIIVSPTPPAAPVITVPASDLVLNAEELLVTGAAEPFIELRAFRSGEVILTTNASQEGGFGFRLPLLEGANTLTVLAADSTGVASSSPRLIQKDTLPPAQLILNPPVYTPGLGLALTWNYASAGKRASRYQAFWSRTPISGTNQATGRSLVLTGMDTRVQGLAPGDYYFYVVGYDAIGNASALSAAQYFLYDPLPPGFQVAFDRPSPLGEGPLRITLIASKPLSGLPILTLQPAGFPPTSLPVTNIAVNTYEGLIRVSGSLPSGPVLLNVSATDASGNVFTGAPTGPELVIDLTPPSGRVTTAPLQPIQTTNVVPIAVHLGLTEAALSGSTPQLTFAPPTGAVVAVSMSGSGTNWDGSLTLNPGMGAGDGHFSLTVSDALGNQGHSLIDGSALEIYNTEFPTPPGQPVGFQATSLADGRVSLTWNPVAKAEGYRVYSEPGNSFASPTLRVADNVASNSFVYRPASDGFHRFGVAATRRGAEGLMSITRVVASDRTPPPAPSQLAVLLVANGLEIRWQAPTGESPAHYNVYRNGILIRTVASAIPVLDNPPRGLMTYTVASSDALGNEAHSQPATYELSVGAVNNLQVLVNSGQAPALSWTSADPTTVGFNVYRNGIRQNQAPLTGLNYLDTLVPGDALVTYAVTAINASNAESAARSVAVYKTEIRLRVNAGGGSSNGLPVSRYFDDYAISVSNRTDGASLPLRQIEVRRAVEGIDPVELVRSLQTALATGVGTNVSMAIPGAVGLAAQTVRIRAVQELDAGGGSVIYQHNADLGAALSPGVMMEVSANQQPLAGGVSSFNLRIHNKGYQAMYFATTRGSGAQPGDVYLSVKGSQGQEVARAPLTASPSGIFFAEGVGYVRVMPGASTTLTVSNVFVPEVLVSNLVTFEGVVTAIYDRPASSGRQVSGPLTGTMLSGLSQTPYYGIAQTDRSSYLDDQPILITGQARDRLTDQPKTNVTLRIGFGTRGYRWSQDVTTDTHGNYSYLYQPPPGFAGSLTLWAAHPQVIDKLDQVQVSVHRMYLTPQFGDIRMSKSGTLRFSLNLRNPSDLPLSAVTIQFQAFEMDGTNQVPTGKLHGSVVSGNAFTIAGGQQQAVVLDLTADADAPDNAAVLFSFSSAEGASAVFTGYTTLLPAVPIVSVSEPEIGYVEVSLDRGGLVSKQVTVVNRGLTDLKGVTLRPPKSVGWMQVNLPKSGDGLIHLPDVPVGGSNSFQVVFTPPAGTELGFYQDTLLVQGTNAPGEVELNVYARITSGKRGAVQFYVDDILGFDVPNAAVRLRNTALQVELPEVRTDINGLVTVTNLQEGDWSWQVTASGYSGNVGSVIVVPDQTLQVSTRLSKSLVTVNFRVTPVPYTDRYEITLEQTFETHVPAACLVLNPPTMAFQNVSSPFKAFFSINVYNVGLIKAKNLAIEGAEGGGLKVEPLITFLPELLPMESIDIPFVFTYDSTDQAVNRAQSRQGQSLYYCQQPGGGGGGGSGGGLGNFLGDFSAGVYAILTAAFDCAKGGAPVYVGDDIPVIAEVTPYMIGGQTVLAGNPLPGPLFGPTPVHPVPDFATRVVPREMVNCFLGAYQADSSRPPLAAVSPTFNQILNQFGRLGNGCLMGDTKILMADGLLKSISEVKPRDIVRCGQRSENVAMVQELTKFSSKGFRELVFENGHTPGRPGSVCITGEHLMWVDGRGWVRADQVKAGDWLAGEQMQRVRVMNNRSILDGVSVYNLKLWGDNAFYANGVLVHEQCGGVFSETALRTMNTQAPSRILNGN